MHGPINIKSPNNTSKWQMGYNSAFKVLKAFGTGEVGDFNRVVKILSDCPKHQIRL
jgi:hypothetical protein